MRDYRSTPAQVFVAACIEMKLKWLARRLRWIDDPADITQWVNTVTAVQDLLKKMIADGETQHKWGVDEQRIPSTSKHRYEISAPHVIRFEREWSSEMEIDVGGNNQLPTMSVDNTFCSKGVGEEVEGTQQRKKRKRVIERKLTLGNMEDSSLEVRESPVNTLSKKEDETDMDSRGESTNEGNDVVVGDEVKGKQAPADNEKGREQKIEEGQAKLLEEEKERWLKGIYDRMGKEIDDTEHCEDVLCQYNTDWKFNRKLKEVAKDLQYELKEDSNGYPLPEKLWKYLFSEINKTCDSIFLPGRY